MRLTPEEKNGVRMVLMQILMGGVRDITPLKDEAGVSHITFNDVYATIDFTTMESWRVLPAGLDFIKGDSDEQRNQRSILRIHQS